MANARLPEKHRPSIGEFDQDGNDGKEGARSTTRVATTTKSIALEPHHPADHEYPCILLAPKPQTLHDATAFQWTASITAMELIYQCKVMAALWRL
jgi:hypothetical protein